MDTSSQIPESNADIVALNLVYHAIIDDINDPGKAIAVLLESMARISRNIGGDERAANADWRAVVSDSSSVELSEVRPLVNRQELAIGDTWAQRWMLMHMAKHLFEELERVCMESRLPSRSNRSSTMNLVRSNHGNYARERDSNTHAESSVTEVMTEVKKSDTQVLSFPASANRR